MAHGAVESAYEAAPSTITAAASQCQRLRGTKAKRTPSPTISASEPRLGRGSSRRAQFQANSTPRSVENASVLATGRLCLFEAGELRGEIVAAPERHERHAGSVQ